jgi:cytochrome c
MSRLALVMTASICLGGAGAFPAGAEDDAGRIAFNTHCRNCHSFKRADNRLGPSLYGILGTAAGQVAGYQSYSGSLAGFTWDEANLDRFIADPRSLAPNTNINYPPVGDAAERAKIIMFLKSQASP